MWTCALIIAGITVLPVRVTRAAPGGAAIAPRRPAATIAPLETTKALSSIGTRPLPSTSRAPS
jgi:hypothetical protein